MAQNIEGKITGLFTNSNALSQVPKSALEIADNCVIKRPGILESRRGQDFYNEAISGTITQLFNYQDKIIAHYDSSKITVEDGSSWSDFAGSYSAPSNYAMRFIEAGGSLFLTSSEGVQIIDDLSETIKNAGAPRALGGQASLTGSSGFMSDDSAIAYRIVWGYENSNERLILGSPSERIIVQNSAGGSRDVSLTFLIPENITENWFYQIYRSSESSSASSVPNDQLALVFEENPTSAQLTAGEITVTDNTPDDLKGAFLYTNDNQDGISQSNDTPPLARDLETFSDHLFYANTTSKHRFFLNLLGVDDESLKYVSETGDTTSGSAIITNVGDTSTLRVGMRVVGTGIPSNTVISSIDSATQVTLDQNATITDTGVSIEFQDRLSIGNVDYFGGSTKDISANQFIIDTSATAAENIEATAKNLIEIINTSSDNSDYYAYYLTNFEELPGKILLEERDLGGSGFSLTSTAGNSFSPTLPESGTSKSSTNERRKNRVYHSKPGEYQAVPILNYFDIGNSNAEIVRIIALREALFVLKQDGVYRIYGDDRFNFQVSTLDNTITCNAAETFVALNNRIFGITNQGASVISDSGVEIISLPIEQTILRTASYDSFNSKAFAIGYETERQWILFCPTNKTDTKNTQAFVYSYLTDSWTRWELTRSCGLIKDDRLYLANPDNDFVYRERKDNSDLDYADESYSVTINSSSGLEITLDSISNVEVGQSIRQGELRRALILSIDGNTLTVDTEQAWDNSSATVNNPIPVKAKTVLIDGKNSGVLKHFTDLDLMFSDSNFRELTVGVESDFSQFIEKHSIENTAKGSFGEFPFGTLAFGGFFGGSAVIPTHIPLEKCQAHWIRLQLELNEAFNRFEWNGYSLQFDPYTLAGNKA